VIKKEGAKISWIPVNEGDDVFKSKVSNNVILQKTIFNGSDNWTVVRK